MMASSGVSMEELSTGNRPIRLRLAVADGVSEQLLLPQRISGTETICGGLEYRVLCVAADATLPLKDFIAAPAELKIVTDRGELHTVCGIVAEASAGQSDGGLATYQLVLRDALSLMEKRFNTRVFRNKNELQIIDILLSEWRQTNSVLAAAFEYEIDASLPARRFPPREFTMQYDESDAHFVRRLMRRRGIAWHFRPGQPGAPTPVHTLVLFDDSARLKQNAAGTIRYHRDHATEQRDAITAWSAVRTLQAGSITRFSWDYKRPKGTDFMFTSSEGIADQGKFGNRFAASLNDYAIAPPHVGDNSDDHRQLGMLRVARHDYDSKCFHGQGGVRDMRVGEWFALEDHPEIDQHAQAERHFIITGLSVSASNNLPKALDSRLDCLFRSSGWDGDAWPRSAPIDSAVRYSNRFTCVRRDVQIVPAYDPRSDLPRTRLQSAIVVGPANEEVHCDALGRVKVRFNATRPGDHRHASGAGASDTETDSAWLRVATPWAGNGPGPDRQCGTLSLPRVGSEVLIDFLGGDPDRPVIVGQLYNGLGVPPGLSRPGDLPGNRYLSGMRSREIRGGRANQLCFDDTSGQISAQLASEHAATQLNLGYLTRPRQDGEGAPRGDGFELRSDASGSIRTARSLLISAWKRLDAAGQQLSNEDSVALMAECLELFKSLGSYAAQHEALPVDDTAATALHEAVKAASGQQPDERPTITVTAPDGIAISSPKTIVSYAGVNYDCVARQHLQLSAGKRCNVNAGQGISMFAHQDGITQIAHHGKYLMQSQHDLMQLDAAKDLRLTSATKLIGVAQDEITFMTNGGAYLKLSGGNIELGGPGALTIKTSAHHWNGPASMRGDLPAFGEGELGRTPRLVAPEDGSPVEGWQANIAGEHGADANGVSSAEGQGPQVLGEHLEKLTMMFSKPRG
jgi:type VI secretion system secreted protein VgrG